MRRLSIFLLLIALIYCVLMLIARPASEHPFYDNLPAGPLIIAHQGGEQLRPSNTMAAFEHAMALEVDMLEMDIHSSRDGVLVTIHDDTVDRTTDGDGQVSELTWQQLRSLDAGYYWTDDDGATYPYRGQGIKIAGLQEIFEAFPQVPMNIEIKQADPPIAQPFCDMLRRFDRTELVLVASFSQQAMQDFRSVCPEVATSLTEDEVRGFFYRYLLWAGQTYAPPAGAVQVPEYRAGFHIVTKRFVRAAHQRNLQVHVWTVNDSAEMAHILDLGVDGIITDRPDLLKEVLQR